jgi:uroporphyrinogen III methyltransferase/synthase
MTVYLVGAGPGDPELLTLRGAKLLTRADVVIYDRLVAAEILDLISEHAVRIDVGKVPGQPQKQDDINALLIEHGRLHDTVVRLKGGDPFVFGRGGEEALALAEAGVACEVVPGLSSSIAASAVAGVPVTHRGVATSFTVVTGHRMAGEADVDWDALGRVGGTIVVLMGVSRRAEIAERLLKSGRSFDEPVAVVHRGTQPQQTVLATTLEKLGKIDIEPPSVMIIGPVAGLNLFGCF